MMESGDESASNYESDTEEEQEEEDQANRERVWPGTREKARKRSIGHATHKNEPGDILQAEYVNKTGNEDRQQGDAKTITAEDINAKDTTAKDRYKRPTEEQEKENEGSQGEGVCTRSEGRGQAVWCWAGQPRVPRGATQRTEERG